MGPISEYETIINNAESWHMARNKREPLQEFQDNFLRKVFQVAAKGTPKGMLCLDSQILPMKWKIVQLKLQAIAKTRGKPDNNLCKQALLDGQKTC